jgi:hypothetical protein
MNSKKRRMSVVYERTRGNLRSKLGETEFSASNPGVAHSLSTRARHLR